MTDESRERERPRWGKTADSDSEDSSAYKCRNKFLTPIDKELEKIL